MSGTAHVHGIYCSQCGKASRAESRAYRYSGEARARQFGSRWQWPNHSIEIFPGAPNVNIFHHVPMGPERTRHVVEVYMEEHVPTAEQEDAIRYIDQVLQVEDIALVESVQRGLRSRGYDQGRFIVDAGRTDMSEHAVHHFHGLVARRWHPRKKGREPRGPFLPGAYPFPVRGRVYSLTAIPHPRQS